MTHPDVKLLLQCRRGSDRAARALWADHARSVRACARALTRDPHAADDIVQHVFCAILEADRAALKRIRDVRAYLVGAARNESMSYLRGERRRLAREAKSERGAPHDAEPIDELSSAISALSDGHREVLLLKSAGGLTFDQLALALGMNRSTAASRHRAALACLRELLDGNDSTQDSNAPSMRTEAQHARS